MKTIFVRVLFFLGLVIVAVSCASYKQNIMFKVSDPAVLSQKAAEAERNYVIQKNDYVKLAVYTSSGERIIDPDLKLLKDIPVQNAETRPDPQYLVDVNGVVKFPMIGEHKMEGLTVRQAEAFLQKEYAKFYTEPFVTLEYVNKRVIVLGTYSKVVPLTNENITLAEILALSETVDITAKAQNIRIIRDEQVYIADFSTLEGYQKTNMIIQHGDIVYVEPVRRPVSEATRDYAPVFSLVISITTLIIVLVGL